GAISIWAAIIPAEARHPSPLAPLRSIRRTRRPLSASRRAHAAPITPAPTITTSGAVVTWPRRNFLKRRSYSTTLLPEYRRPGLSEREGYHVPQHGRIRWICDRR